MKIRKAFADIPNSSSTDWSSLTGTPPPVSTFANDAGYLTSVPAHNHAAGDITSGVLSPLRGGTGINTYVAGQLIYAASTSALAALNPGSNGQVLTMVSGSPAWAAAGGGVDLAADYPWTGYHSFSPTRNAVSGLASAMLINPTLNATAHNDVLVGLDINPTFNAASYASVKKAYLRIAGTLILSADTNHNLNFGNGNNALPTAGYGLFFGYDSGFQATGAHSSNFIGRSAGNNATNAYESNFFGYNSGVNASGAYLSNFIGKHAGQGATNAWGANFFGHQAGVSASSANRSNFFGTLAGLNATNAVRSNFFGDNAGGQATNASNSNFIGVYAGSGATGASYSTFIGWLVGYNSTHAITGSNNILIGTNITTPAAASSNMFSIGNVLFGFNCYSTLAGTPSKLPAVNGKVAIGTNTPATSAILDLTSTTMGLLPPRMTTTQINAIASPVAGLIAYNNEINMLCFYNGTAWQKITGFSAM